MRDLLLLFLIVLNLFIITSSASSCEIVKCKEGTNCVEHCGSSDCVAACLPVPSRAAQASDCSSLGCKEGDICVEECLVDGTCVAFCKPIDGTPQAPGETEIGCTAGTCLGSYCILGEDGLPKCVGFEEYACSQANCPEGLKCLANEQKCSSSSSPCPQYSCVQSGFDICPKKGPEKCVDACPAIYAPVCASNGVTYSSECALTVENCNKDSQFTVLHQGECKEIPSPQNACDSITCEEADMCLEDPKYCETTPCPQFKCIPYSFCALVKCSSEGTSVCGSDGVTYVNTCQMNQTMCRELRIIYAKHEGACENAVPNPCNSNPCGESEICLRDPQYCFTTPCSQFHCVPCSFCSDSCQDNYQPVCGDDGVSYTNECHLRSASCLERRVISIQHAGECEKAAPQANNPCASKNCGADSICLEDPKPCSEEGEGNSSKAETETCEQYSCYPKSKCPEMCPLNYEPFCASDGKTYGNQCELAMAICHERKVFTVLHAGPCG